jgi:cytochrome P450
MSGRGRHAHTAAMATPSTTPAACLPAGPAWLDDFTLALPPPGFIDDPYPFYAVLRERSPVHALAPDVRLLTRHDDLVRVYRHPAASSDKRREFGPKYGEGSPLFEHHTTSLVFSDPPLHTRVRRLLVGALNQRAIARMDAGVQALVDRLIDGLLDRQGADLIEDFAAGIPVDVIGNLLDVPQSLRTPLRGWSLAILSALEPAPSPAVLAAGHFAVTDFLAMLRELVDDRRRHPGDPQSDVLTRLLQGDGSPDGQFTEAELLHNCIFLLNAGHETTTNLLGNGVHALLTHRDQWQRLLDDPTLLPTAVEELLRFESPLQLNNRLTTAPIELADTVLPPGIFVTLAIGAANRDPAVFAEPDRLDVARKPNAHVAFGHSAHACAGMNVARLEARIALGRLLARCPRLDLAGAPERDPRVRFRGFRRLPIQVG